MRNHSNVCLAHGCSLLAAPCNQEEFDLKSDYIRWRRKSFSFAAHAFMYEPAAKAELLRIENQLEMCALFPLLLSSILLSSNWRLQVT